MNNAVYCVVTAQEMQIDNVVYNSSGNLHSFDLTVLPQLLDMDGNDVFLDKRVFAEKECRMNAELSSMGSVWFKVMYDGGVFHITCVDPDSGEENTLYDAYNGSVITLANMYLVDDTGQTVFVSFEDSCVYVALVDDEGWPMSPDYDFPPSVQATQI